MDWLISLTYASWRTMEKNLDCELPHKDELSDTICSSGIHAGAHVVIVGNTDTELQLMNATRVAWTLKYAGVKHPAILDGGFKKWVSSNYPVSKDWVKLPKTDQKCIWNENVLATKKYIESHLGKVTIVDTRSESLYRGEKVRPHVEKKRAYSGSGKPSLFPRLYKGRHV
jgi:thiosulfate/3-mercaptopyruvate sulfurtransferase